MDSRIDWFHGFKKKVLEGHRAMVSLGEDNEDAPYPSPRPITGLPEPIPGEAFWEKSYSESTSESISDAESSNRSESCLQFEKNGENTQTPLESKSKIDHCSEPSFGSTEEEFLSYIGELKSDLADLQMEVKDLNKYINNLHSDHDDCMNRVLILQDSVERSDEYQDFYRKLFESTKYKGGNGIIKPAKREKQVRYHHGKRVQDDEPLVVDPFVKALVDKRLEPITFPGPGEDKLRILEKDEMCKTGDSEKKCNSMEKGGESINIVDNDDAGWPKVMDMFEMIPPVNDVERIGMIDFLNQNKEEGVSACIENHKINNFPPIEESFSFQGTLGKYQKLSAIGLVPYIPLSDLHADSHPRISSSDESMNKRDASTKLIPKSTVNRPNLSIKEKRKQTRLAKILEPERPTIIENMSSTLPKIKLSSGNIRSASPKIKSSTQNIISALPKILSGNSSLPKIQPFSGNNNSVLPKINSSSGNINSGNTNSTRPKIKSMPVKDYIKGNNKMAMKIKTPVLPNLMKSIPTIPKVYKPTPPTVKPTKRPYTAKYRKLPPILDLNAELEKQNTFKDT